MLLPVRVRKVTSDLESEAAMRTKSEYTGREQREIEAMAARAPGSQDSEPVGRTPPAGRSPESRARWAFAMVLLLGSLAGYAWFWLASGNYTTYQIRTHDPVSGLMVDAPVEFHGVDVGRVTRVELIDPRSVSVWLQIRKEAPVTTATVATVTSRGLASKGFTGYVYVSLEDDDTDAKPVAALTGDAYGQIRTAPSRSVNLDTAISQVNENVQSMSRLLQTSLDEKTLASLKQSVEGMQRVTRTLAANSEKMNAIIVNAERASSRLEPLLESTNETAKALQTQLLPEAYDALAKLDRLSTTLNNAATRLERDPSSLVRGAGKRLPGPGEAK
jgi:phospholipid/cholesterol/gamma-HCH transport system substrate-binding protein